jgi:hypothetical protein
VLNDLENVRQMILELVEFGDRLGEAVFQIEIRLQLAVNVELRRVFEVREFLSELCLARFQLIQQTSKLIGIRELTGLHGADKPFNLIERVLER